MAANTETQPTLAPIITPGQQTVIPLYTCKNCPSRPQFLTKDDLITHWRETHTVAMVVVDVDPWGERPPRTRKLVEGPDV